MLDVIEQLLQRSAIGETVAVCVIVKTRGSTPQRQGAMMLVLADGKTLGTLGGGCVEAEVRVRAMQLMQDRASRLLTFKLDHDYGWDDGLVCGGAMDVAVQVIDSESAASPWRDVRDQLAANRGATIGISVPDEQGEIACFEHKIAPTPTLVIAGGGHVGLALAALMRRIDFRVVVIDDRPDYASAERFPGATCIIGEIEQELSRFPIDEYSYIVIVTRGHRHDGRALAAVIGSAARYVGLIGSKRKVLTILKDLHDQGISREQLSRVHAPIGLNIGAITPGEIAISIAAELIAIRRGKGDGVIAPMKISLEKTKWSNTKE